MKPCMLALISDTQGAFVHDRSIFDNILVAYEIAHSMKGKRSGHVGFVRAKFDMSKGYDRIECVYVTSMIRVLGFSERWIAIIYNCISSFAFSWMINSRRYAIVTPYRGIR